jgi:hypothetical protein
VSAAQFVGASYFTFLVLTKSANYFAYSCSAGGGERLSPLSVCVFY